MKCPAIHCALRVDAVAQARPHVPFDRHVAAWPAARAPCAARRRGSGRRPRRGSAGPAGAPLISRQMLGAGQQARIADDAGRRGRAPQSHVQGHHGALAEADQHQPVGAKADNGRARASRKRSSAGWAATTPRQYSLGSRSVRANHCRPPYMPGIVSGALGATNDGIGQPAPPAVGERDQVVAVGAIAVQQHHQAVGARPRGSRRGPSSLQHLDRHRRAFLLERGVVRPQQPRRHAAPGPPALADLLQRLVLGRSSSPRARCAAICSARSPGAQPSARPRQNMM